jgi:hypothetical protein
VKNLDTKPKKRRIKMLNGFFEYGLVALIGFGFVNLVWAMTLLSEMPPALPGEESRKRFSEEEPEIGTPIRTLAA